MIPAIKLIDTIVDDGSFVPDSHGPRLIWGVASIREFPVVVVCNEMEVTYGAMGTAELAAFVEVFRRGIRDGLPVIWLARGSGLDTRDCIPSAFAVGEVLHERKKLADTGKPFITVATDVLIGTSYAIASQSDFLFSTVDASLYYFGHRVIGINESMPQPVGFQSAEWVCNHGHLDGVIDANSIRDVVGNLIHCLCCKNDPVESEFVPERIQYDGAPDFGAWIEKTRNTTRQSPRTLIERIARVFVELKGDRLSYDDSFLFGGVAEIGGISMIIIGTNPPEAVSASIRQSFSRPRPAAIRKAIRLVSLATRHALPILSMIDTSVEAAEIRSEEENLAGLIGRLASEMATVPVPTVSIVSGPAQGMVALSLAMTDIRIMTEYSYLSPMGLQALGFKLYRDPSRIEDAARDTGIAPWQLRESGRTDTILPTTPESVTFEGNLAAAICTSFQELAGKNAPTDRRWNTER